ncbi:3-phenylpropionate/cinnamic acid dioxygenase subunit beta [uncultured Alteromonas sp.]|uniref:aromatic-ring-hydroxylating dioxygenase subunit beta n=1 Tax=uncultured Alteromonas sp. TaxID=179113 RepID=UPI0030CDD636|tara:strand:- start:17409 stop:17966 length:558 start_codon:yes stop_codon:yes gene_type:complete
MTHDVEQSVMDAMKAPVAIGSERYNTILTFLYQEASFLDNLKLAQWGETLATDLVYNIPIRQTRASRDNDKSIVRSCQHMLDDYRSMMGRIMRLAGNSAWAEDPPSRVRRFITNVLVYTTDNADEFLVVSNMLVTRNRFDDDHYDLISGVRTDILRVDGDTYKLARREVIIDQAVLGTPNLGIFL